MSHAANLRTHQQHAASSKRRKLSSETSTRPLANGVNGALNASAFRSLSAKHKHNAKASTKLAPAEAAARIGRAAEDEEMTEEINGVNDDSSVDTEEDSDDDDDEDNSADADDDDETSHPRKPHKRRSSQDNYISSKPHNDSHRQPNGVSTKQSLEQNLQEDEGQEPPEEPSFGDLLRAQGTEQIDVPADENNAANLLSSRPTGTLAAPSAASLGTVLTQALRSNDLALLESCLQISNLQSIRATVERLPSVHAATLLQKLAERMHKRPGRAGSLMVWVQWTVVAHGGYLATQPAAMTQVKELYRVVKMRATSLQPLLALKGKLDMLEAQVALRRRHTAATADEQENVVYVEDEESSDDDSVPPPGTKAHRKVKADDMALLGSSDDDEAMPLTNGTSVPASDEEDADAGLEEELESDEAEDFIDDEAESTDNDSDGGASDDDIVFDEVEDDEGSDDERSRPTKRAKAKR